MGKNYDASKLHENLLTARMVALQVAHAHTSSSRSMGPMSITAVLRSAESFEEWLLRDPDKKG